MSRNQEFLPTDIARYIRASSLREPDVLQRLRTETARLPNGGMQISAEQGQFMALLVRLLGASRCLEVGVFTGYSSLVVARALPPEGRLVACDVSREYTDVARRYWREGGVAERVDLRLGPAIETLDALLEAGEAGRFDFAFIDADKGNYPGYYERALKLVRAGGLIAIDNTLWSGKVADAAVRDETTELLRRFNSTLYADTRIDLSLLPVGDGLTLARKR